MRFTSNEVRSLVDIQVLNKTVHIIFFLFFFLAG